LSNVDLCYGVIDNVKVQEGVLFGIHGSRCSIRSGIEHHCFLSSNRLVMAIFRYIKMRLIICFVASVFFYADHQMGFK